MFLPWLLDFDIVRVFCTRNTDCTRCTIIRYRCHQWHDYRLPNFTFRRTVCTLIHDTTRFYLVMLTHLMHIIEHTRREEQPKGPLSRTGLRQLAIKWRQNSPESFRTVSKRSRVFACVRNCLALSRQSFEHVQKICATKCDKVVSK